jgi:hypothetical protein
VDGGEYIVPLVYTVWLRGKLVSAGVEADGLPVGAPLVDDELVQAPTAVTAINPDAAMAAILPSRHRLSLVVVRTGPTSSVYKTSVPPGLTGQKGRKCVGAGQKDPITKPVKEEG